MPERTFNIRIDYSSVMFLFVYSMREDKFCFIRDIFFTSLPLLHIYFFTFLYRSKCDFITLVHVFTFHARFISRNIALSSRSLFSRYCITRYSLPRYLFLTSSRDILLGEDIIAIFNVLLSHTFSRYFHDFSHELRVLLRENCDHNAILSRLPYSRDNLTTAGFPVESHKFQSENRKKKFKKKFKKKNFK